MNKTTPLLILISLSLYCCQQKDKDHRIHYCAIKGKDTALLSVTIYKERFYGEYQMIYGKSGKDSGSVRGQFVGDTLKGEYKYISFGGVESISPIQFLKKEDKLLLGKGVKATYMGIPFYVKEIPVDYNTGFIFEEINP